MLFGRLIVKRERLDYMLRKAHKNGLATGISIGKILEHRDKGAILSTRVHRDIENIIKEAGF